MGATNHTTNYNLPQFVGSDKPTWLGDVNGAMNSIDTQMKANFDLATTAKNTADTASTTAGTALENASVADEKAVTAGETATSALNKALENESDITALETANSYTTSEEIVVGTWTNGKPIYRKVYTINLLATDRNKTITIPNSIISNVNEITAINGMVKGTYGFFPIYYSNPNGSVVDGIGIYYGLSMGIGINMGEITLDNNSSAKITIEYTKTTD